MRLIPVNNMCDEMGYDPAMKARLVNFGNWLLEDLNVKKRIRIEEDVFGDHHIRAFWPEPEPVVNVAEGPAVGPAVGPAEGPAVGPAPNDDLERRNRLINSAVVAALLDIVVVENPRVGSEINSNDKLRDRLMNIVQNRYHIDMEGSHEAERDGGARGR